MLVTPPQGASGAKSLGVLHIDDDPDAREIVSKAIGSDESLSLHSCASGEDALTATENWSPDLILLDVMMPGMDGPTTLSRLRQRPQTSGVPVIYVSARAKADGLENPHAAGVAGFIEKPVDPMTFQAEINTVLLQAYRKLATTKRATEDDAALAKGIFGSVEDLTQRKRAEDRFRRVVEAAPAAMVMADQAGRIALVNRQTEKLFGYAAGELLGRSIELLMPEHQRIRHPDHVRGYFVSPAMLDSSERAMGGGLNLKGLRKDGSQFPVEIGLTPIQTDDGPMVLGAIVDITQRQRAEEQILLFNERLEQEVALRTVQLESANQALDEFAYAASHDLKAPLRVIDNASRWLEEDLAAHLNDETRQHMDLLRGRVARLEKLLDDLLRFSRIGREDGGTEIISGREVMDNVLALLNPPLGFTVAVDPTFAAITVARMPLQQVLMNLIGNAIKHHDRPAGRIDVMVEDRGATHAFAVRDDGPGISAQFHDKVFKMFQTLKPRDQVEGSGMGLAIARKQVELSGGTLTLESAHGQGSTFRFTLPAPDRAV